jgi:O-acetyl-ADP-ribose deacetylase (regulator of RNase III)
MSNVNLELIKGDITEQETDAIVNTANTLLILGSGLGGAIKAKGGESISKECSKIGAIEIGEAAVTGAGNLKARFIIHAALTEFDGLINEKHISSALLNSLRLANNRKFRSIAVPDMSMGIVRFPPEQCGQIMLSVLKQFIETENRTLELVALVVWDIDTLRLYKKIYSSVFGQEYK